MVIMTILSIQIVQDIFMDFANCPYKHFAKLSTLEHFRLNTEDPLCIWVKLIQWEFSKGWYMPYYLEYKIHI